MNIEITLFTFALISSLFKPVRSTCARRASVHSAGFQQIWPVQNSRRFLERVFSDQNMNFGIC